MAPICDVATYKSLLQDGSQTACYFSVAKHSGTSSRPLRCGCSAANITKTNAGFCRRESTSSLSLVIAICSYKAAKKVNNAHEGALVTAEL